MSNGPHLVVRPVLIIEIEQDEFWEEYALQFITPLHRPFFQNGSSNIVTEVYQSQITFLYPIGER